LYRDRRKKKNEQLRKTAAHPGRAGAVACGQQPCLLALHPPGGQRTRPLAPCRRVALRQWVASGGSRHVFLVEAQPQPALPQPPGPAAGD